MSETFFGKRMQYWTAKEIMEILEYQDDQRDEMNDSARESGSPERWSVASCNVTFEISEGFGRTKRTLVIETLLFDEFCEDPKRKYKSLTDRLDDKYVKTIADYAKVIEDYFEYFNDAYDCQFGVFDRRK